MYHVPLKSYCSLLAPHVLGEDMDQLASLCKGLMLFGLGAKVFLMSAINSVGKKTTPILYLRMAVSFQISINMAVPRTTTHP